MSYNLSDPSGPNPLTTNVNSQLTDTANDVWIQVASGCVWPIMPGIALLYAGLSHKRSGTSLLFVNFMTWGVVTITWFCLGYSLATAPNGGPMIGSFLNGGFKHVEASVSPGSAVINEVIYSVFECYFCVATVCIVMGGFNERARVLPSLVFAACFSVLVYSIESYWEWSPNGWLYKLGAVDFAGGNCVHISGGYAALVVSWFLGKRKDFDRERKLTSRQRKNDTVMVFLGTSLIYFGWMFFNSGTALNDTIRSSYAFANTNLAASAGMITYALLHYVRNRQRWSVIAACEGVIAGLVGITPAAGFVPFHFAIVTGIATAAVCNLTDGVTRLLGIDEGLEVFNLHGTGGFIGSVCTALFAADWVAALDGSTKIAGGWINGNYIQLGYNLAASVSVAAWTSFMTFALLHLINVIPGLKFRISEAEEEAGFDATFMDEQLDVTAIIESFSGISQTINEPVEKKSL